MHNKGRYFGPTLIVLLSTILTVLLLLFRERFYAISVFIGAIFIVIFLYLKARDMLLLYFFAIIVLPLSIYAKPPIIYGINDYHIIGGFLFIFSVLIIKIIFNLGGIRKRKERLPLSFGIFELIVVFFTVIGYIKGYKSEWLLREFFYLSLYFFTFFFINGEDIISFIKKFEKVLFISSVVILIEYILRYYWAFSHFDLRRVVTQQGNIILFAFPLAFYSIFQQQSFKKRFIRIFTALSCILLAILSLQRSLWLILSADIILGFAYFIFSFGVNRETFKKILAVIIILAILITLLIVVINSYFNVIKLVRERLSTLSDKRITEDKSLNVRAEDFMEVKSLILRDFFLGAGIAAPIFQKNTGLHKEIVDNSYAVLIYKIGLIGLLSLLALYFNAIKGSFCQILNRRDNYFFFAILVSLINYLVISTSSSAMFYYRFNVIIGILFAIVLKTGINSKKTRDEQNN